MVDRRQRASGQVASRANGGGKNLILLNILNYKELGKRVLEDHKGDG
jgi:hypothetical protein